MKHRDRMRGDTASVLTPGSLSFVLGQKRADELFPLALGFSLSGLFCATSVLRSHFLLDPPRLFLDILLPDNGYAMNVVAALVVNLFNVMSPSPL